MGAIVIKANKQRVNVAAYSRARALIKYVDDPDKCTAKQSANMLEDTGVDAARELALLCDTANPDQKLIHHHVISFKGDPGENITDEQLYDVAADYMHRMGMDNCPQHMAIHRNTAHPHLHIVFAQVDAETGKKNKMPLYRIAGQKTIATMAKKYGWKLHARSRFAIENDTLKALTPPPREIPQELKAQLEDFCNKNREKFSGWKWANLHQELAELGISLEYRQADGLFASLDGKKWYKTAYITDELTYAHLASQINAKSYRKARPEVLDRLAAVRSGAPTSSSPLSAGDEKTQEHAQKDAPNKARIAKSDTPKTEERKPMTPEEIRQFKIQYGYAKMQADDATRATLEALEKDDLFNGAKQKEFAAQIAPHLQKIHESKYSDADAYARLRINAARYHAHLIIADARREERSLEIRRKNAAIFDAHAKAAAKYANSVKERTRIMIAQMRQSGGRNGQIARAMLDGASSSSGAEISQEMQAIHELFEYLAEMSVPYIPPPPQTPIEKRLAAIEAQYDRCLVPKEFRDEYEAEKKAAILAATSLDRWRRGNMSRRNEADRIEITRRHAGERINMLMDAIQSQPKYSAKDLREHIKDEIHAITENIAEGKNAKNEESYKRLEDKLAAYKTAQAVDGIMEPATALDATIYARHAEKTAKITDDPTKASNLIALRLRGTGHEEAEAVRIMVAGGVSKTEAARAVGEMFNTTKGDNALKNSQEFLADWRKDERGQAANKPGQQAARPAAAAAQPAPAAPAPRR